VTYCPSGGVAGEIGEREACREHNPHRDTLKKVLAHEEPPGSQFKRPRPTPAPGPSLPVIHATLEADRQAPNERRHTTRRTFDRPRGGHADAGCASTARAAAANGREPRADVVAPETALT
jgi:hypothetical protein